MKFLEFTKKLVILSIFGEKWICYFDVITLEQCIGENPSLEEQKLVSFKLFLI
jgi:hypothetical protein